MKILPESNACIRCGHEVCARKVALFSGLSEDELRGVLDLIRRRFVPKGDFVFSEGDPGDTLIIVNRGSLKIHTETRDGREQILYLLQEGEFIGDLNLLKSTAFSFSGTALEDTHLCMIRKPDFDTLLRQNPEIGLKVLAYAHERIIGLETLVQTLTLKDADTRLAVLLRSLAEKNGTPALPASEFSLPLSREDMAAAIGLTRETISRKLSLLSSEGIIALPSARRIRILDMEALRERSEHS